MTNISKKILNKIYSEVVEYVFYCTAHVIMSPFVHPRIRNVLLRVLGFKVGRGVHIYPFSFFGSNRFSVGRGSAINIYGIFDTSDHIRIGDFTRLGPRVTIITASHHIAHSEFRRDPRDIYTAPVTIGDGCWIGSNTTVLPGITIGNGSVVAAGSVVTRDLPPNGLYGGAPAKLLKELPIDPECDRELKAHLSTMHV